MKTEVINLEVSKEECMEIFRERNGKGEIVKLPSQKTKEIFL